MDTLYYVYVVRLVRPEAFGAPTEEEQRVIGLHFTYLKQNMAQGRVLLAGPTLDGAFGLVILKMDSEAAARDFMANDPVVIHNVMSATLHPLKMSLLADAEQW